MQHSVVTAHLRSEMDLATRNHARGFRATHTTMDIDLVVSSGVHTQYSPLTVWTHTHTHTHTHSSVWCSDKRSSVRASPRCWSSPCPRSPPGRGSECWQENRPLQTASSGRRTGRGCLRTLRRAAHTAASGSPKARRDQGFHELVKAAWRHCFCFSGSRRPGLSVSRFCLLSWNTTHLPRDRGQRNTMYVITISSWKNHRTCLNPTS